MANVLVDETSLQNIAHVIRKKGGTGNYKPSQMADAINSVHNKNIRQLWSAIQNRTNGDYSNLFSGFTDPIFIPIRNLTPINATSMFELSKITDLTALLNNANVNLDLTKATGLYRMFFYSTITRCPRFILPKDSTLNLNCTFHTCQRLVTIDGFFTTVDNKFTQTFYNCASLKNITFETGAKIGNSISFAQSPLSRKSIESIINALSNSVKNKKLSLKKTAVNNAFGINVNDVTTYPKGSEFYTLRHSKDNWTFNYL